jgi:hypothetical protein
MAVNNTVRNVNSLSTDIFSSSTRGNCPTNWPACCKSIELQRLHKESRQQMIADLHLLHVVFLSETGSRTDGVLYLLLLGGIKCHL